MCIYIYIYTLYVDIYKLYIGQRALLHAIVWKFLSAPGSCFQMRQEYVLKPLSFFFFYRTVFHVIQ